MQHSLALLLLAIACRSDEKPADSAAPFDTYQLTDADGDGFSPDDGEDCDDSDASIHPQAQEICDGLDNDCDGQTDEADASDATTWYADADGDEFGVEGDSQQACDKPAGHTAVAGDCDDGDPQVHPGADEQCDGIDDDCDGQIDEGLLQTWYADADGDGHGDPQTTMEACEADQGWVAEAGDCDDGCAACHPGAEETCDELDNDCDGAIDEKVGSTWYADHDGDGFGDAGETVEACELPTGYTDSPGDCDDANSDVNPDAVETCNGIDDDCDGDSDEDDAADASTWYADADSDGFGDPDTSTQACDLPSGHAADDSDCDDSDAAVNPDAQELCNGVDDDCDGDTDEDDAADASTWYADDDADGYGDANAITQACEQPSGHTDDDSDCDDSDDAVNPDATELCNGVDDDCDGDSDEDDAADASTWYADDDADGFGDPDDLLHTCCDCPQEGVEDASDCDDADAAVNPDATEHCNGVDDDCDGDADEDDAADASTWYADTDGDGYGDADSSTQACDQPSGHVADDSDCEDGDASAYPGSTDWEHPDDGVDQDCDGNDGCSDLNCDDLADLLFPSYRTDSSYLTSSRVFYGTGYGFASSYGLSLDSEGSLAAMAQDLDGDGYQDIVLGGYYDGSSYQADTHVYWGSASGHSTSDRTSLATEAVIDIEADDLDGDGWPDLVFASYRNSSDFDTSSMVYWGSSSGYADSDRTELPTYGPRDVDIEDLDGDGYPDLVFANYRTSSSYDISSLVYWGSASGYAESDVTELPTHGAFDVEVQDLNDDGYLDLVFANYYEDSSYSTDSYVYWGEAGGYSSSNYDALPTLGARDVEIEDLDGDGYADLVFANYYDSSYAVSSYVYWGNSGGYSSSDVTGLATYGATGLDIADMDGDGWPDLAFANYYDGSTRLVDSYVYWGSSGGYATSADSLETVGAFRVLAADLDGDGWTDLVFTNYYDDSSYELDSYVYYGSASGFSSSVRDELPVDAPWGYPLVVGGS